MGAVARLAGRGRGSLRLRVTMLAAGLFAVTLVVVSAALLRSLEHRLRDDITRADREALFSQASSVLSGGLPAGAFPVAGGFVVVDGTRVVQIGGDEQVLRSLGGAASTAQPATVAMAVTSSGSIASSVTLGGLEFTTSTPLARIQDSIAATRRLLWLLGPLLVGVVGGFAWFAVGRALRPVHLVTSQVAAIGSSSLHERVPVPGGGDEIAGLATTMNSMLGRLESAASINQRLVSDASHELRTPVAVMRTELEVALHDAAPDWPATGTVVLGELDRLQQLIDDLLTLARGDERALMREPVSVVDLVHESAARRRELAVRVDVAGSVPVLHGDGVAVARALDHLVGNAVRHARSTVQVSAAVDGTDVVIHVDDDGPGIPEDRRDVVVQRFVRLDEGRSRDRGGAGLGLAVAADVAAAHGGALAIDGSPLGGARVTLRLPIG